VCVSGITRRIKCLIPRNVKTRPVAVFLRRDRAFAALTAKEQKEPLRLFASVDTLHAKAMQQRFSGVIVCQPDAGPE